MGMEKKPGWGAVRKPRAYNVSILTPNPRAANLQMRLSRCSRRAGWRVGPTTKTQNRPLYWPPRNGDCFTGAQETGKTTLTLFYRRPYLGRMKYMYYLLMALMIAGCVAPSSGNDSNNPLTHGNVQLNLKTGVTTQAEVLEKFGAPNITTIDGQGREVWSYQRNATVSTASSGYATIILLGGSRSGFEQSSRTMTLIIKFGSDKIVSDFNSMSSSF